MNNQIIRASIRTLYDMQKIRIQSGNRICASFRVKLGLESSQPEDEVEDASDLLKDLRAEYKRITDGVKKITRHFKSDSQIITTRGELALIEAYEMQLKAEAIHEKAIIEELNNTQIWNDFLLGVKGCGPLMAGVIVSEIDIAKCNSISALWKYCGLDVLTVEDIESGEIKGEGRCRKRHHLEEKSYINREGKEATRVGITFNPFLKTKLVGVLGPCFIKCGGHYSEIYRGYKFRLQNHPAHADKTKGHQHAMAIRYMTKMFVADLWRTWRIMEGLEVKTTYHEGVLGHKHHQEAA